MQNFLVGATLIFFLTLTSTEAKPRNAAILESGTFGQIDNRNSMVDEDDELQSYGGSSGGGRFESQPFAISAPVSAVEPPRQPDLAQMNMLIRLIVDEIRNRRMGHEAASGHSYTIPMRPTSFGKRQIVYRQCFFNPISCF